MTVALKKIEQGKYEVKVNREPIGVAVKDYRGMYIIKFEDGREISAVSQDALKRMIKKYY